MKKKLEISRQDQGNKIEWDAIQKEGEGISSDDSSGDGSDNSSRKNSFHQVNGYYLCDFCNYSSDKSANLNRHVRSMHETVKDTLICCGLKFFSKSDYRDHNKMVHKEGHTCPVCKKSFSRRALLKRHQSVHTGVKDFKCNFCHYSSSHKSNVIRHMKIHKDKERIVSGSQASVHEESGRKASLGKADSTSLVTSGREGGQDDLAFQKPRERGRKVRKTRRSVGSSILMTILNSKSGEESKGVGGIKHSIDSILQLSSCPPGRSGRDGILVKEEADEDVETVEERNEWMDEGGEGRKALRSSSESYCWDRDRRDGVAGDESLDRTCLKLEEGGSAGRREGGIGGDARADLGRNPGGNPYSLTNNFTGLPYGMNGFPGTNWNSVPAAFRAAYAPYPFFGLAAGFGSLIGFEESRLLSSPLLQSPSGAPLPIRETCIGAAHAIISPPSAHLPPTSKEISTSAFRTVEKRNGGNLMKNSGYLNSTGFHTSFAEPGRAPVNYSMQSVSSNSTGSEFNARYPQSYGDPGFTYPSMYRGTPPQAHLNQSGGNTDLYDNNYRNGARLSFTQVTNAQVTHFVSY